LLGGALLSYWEARPSASILSRHEDVVYGENDAMASRCPRRPMKVMGGVSVTVTS